MAHGVCVLGSSCWLKQLGIELLAMLDMHLHRGFWTIVLHWLIFEFLACDFTKISYTGVYSMFDTVYKMFLCHFFILTRSCFFMLAHHSIIQQCMYHHGARLAMWLQFEVQVCTCKLGVIALVCGFLSHSYVSSIVTEGSVTKWPCST